MTGPDRARRLAWAGIVGPAIFVGSWVAAGAATPGYRWPVEPISRLAAIGAPHRGLMTTGLVGFAIAMPLFAAVLRRVVPGPAWLAALASGIGTAAVAATPLDRSAAVDAAHAVAATSAYGAMVALPIAAAPGLAGMGHRRAAAGSVATGLAAGLLLTASTAGAAVGLFQRAGLTVVDVWIVAAAAAILRRHRKRPAGRPI